MKQRTLRAAVEAAEAFIAEARAMKVTFHDMGGGGSYTELEYGTRRSGRVRRRSLDLSEALVALRKPRV